MSGVPQLALQGGGGEGLVRPRQFPEVGRAGLELQALCLEATERV